MGSPVSYPQASSVDYFIHQGTPWENIVQGNLKYGVSFA